MNSRSITGEDRDNIRGPYVQWLESSNHSTLTARGTNNVKLWCRTDVEPKAKATFSTLFTRSSASAYHFCNNLKIFEPLHIVQAD
jgi:hypothetical protein